MLSAGGGEFDKKGGDHRESVPFSCRLVDANSFYRIHLLF
jgi:hypothetical protein